MNLKFSKIRLGLFAAFILICLNTTSNSQVKAIYTWYDRLYEKDINYENFACDLKDRENVSNYFKTHPLKKFLPICHNDCPIVKIRAAVPYPQAAKSFRADGEAAVHILVDEEGKTVYARMMTGNFMLRKSILTAACNTQFRKYNRKHQGVLHFTIDSFDEITAPSRANIVFQ